MENGFFSGKKTYLVAGATVLFALLGLFTGNMDFNQVVTMILAALGASTLRHGIKTEMFE